MHNTMESPKHNALDSINCFVQISVCCGLFPLCCANFVALGLVSIVLC